MEKVRKIPQDDIIKTLENNIIIRKVAEGIPENKQKIVFAYIILIKFNNYLDKKHGKINIAGYSFHPSKILNKLNPAGYLVQSRRFMKSERWHKV
jgi:hypothetical protein